jgi:hypothetical protein
MNEEELKEFVKKAREQKRTDEARRQNERKNKKAEATRQAKAARKEQEEAARAEAEQERERVLKRMGQTIISFDTDESEIDGSTSLLASFEPTWLDASDTRVPTSFVKTLDDLNPVFYSGRHGATFRNRDTNKLVYMPPETEATLSDRRPSRKRLQRSETFGPQKADDSTKRREVAQNPKCTPGNPSTGNTDILSSLPPLTRQAFPQSSSIVSRTISNRGESNPYVLDEKSVRELQRDLNTTPPLGFIELWGNHLEMRIPDLQMRDRFRWEKLDDEARMALAKLGPPNEKTGNLNCLTVDERKAWNWLEYEINKDSLRARKQLAKKAAGTR